MSLPLELDCLVLGNNPSRVFPVEIAATKSVGSLRELIKDKKKFAFDHVPAHTPSPNIFKVSFPMDDDLDTVLKRFRPEHDPDNGVHYLSSPTKRLKEVFEDRVDKHIHVIVQPPRELSFIVACVNNSSRHSALSCSLLLLCFISGDNYPSEVFPVKIASTDSVYTLKKAIKEKNNIYLQHVDASALKLWRVSIPVDHGFKEYVRNVKLNDEEALSPAE